VPLFSQKEVLNLKLSAIPAPMLQDLANQLGVSPTGTAAQIIKRILATGQDEETVNRFIKQMYLQRIAERRNLISDDDLKQELFKVKTFAWGIVQGQIDRKIQSEYVRRIVRYDDLVKSVRSKLHDDITNYVVCTWFNHWTTVLIEEHISAHKAVVPTLKPIKGTDIFFDGQPFDLKVTYLPRNYDPASATKNPTELAIWMYENQGEQRFGDDNRLFVVLFDAKNPDNSWELKRDFDLVFNRIDAFFNREKIKEGDEIAFTYKGKSYTAVTKVLLITK
jgi:hypothetical protein